MSPLKLAWLSLSRHRSATLISVLAIGISVACGGVLLRLHQLSESRFATLGRGGDAIVGAKASGLEILLGALNGEGAFPDFLPYKLFESLRAEQMVLHSDGALTQPSYIESITPFVYFGTLDHSGALGDHKYRVVGTDESFYRKKRSGESLILREGRWFSSSGEVVLGARVAEDMGLKVGDTVRVSPWVGGEEELGSGRGREPFVLSVSGLLLSTGSQWDRTLFSSLAQAQQVFEKNRSYLGDKSIWGSQVLHYFLVDLHPGGFIPLKTLINKRTVGQVILVEEERSRLKEISGLGKKLSLLVTALVLLMGGLAVGSMLITRFEGMSLQIAVLRALGYTKKELSQWLLWEGFLLGVMGLILGATMDAISLPLIRSLLGSALPSPDLVSSCLFDSAGVWVVALLATVTSVFVPIIRISRQNTHQTLGGL